MGIPTVEHPEQCTGQNLDGAARPGVASRTGEAPSIGEVTGEFPVGRRDDHPGAGPVGRDPADGRPADARASHVEPQRLDEAAVEHFEHAGSFVTDEDPVVGPCRGDPRTRTGDSDGAVRSRAVPAYAEARALTGDLHPAPGQDVHHATLVDGAGVRIGEVRAHVTPRDTDRGTLAPHQQPAAVADGGGPAPAPAEPDGGTGREKRIACIGRSGLDDFEARPGPVDQERPDAVLVAGEMEERRPGAAAVAHPDQPAVQDLDGAARPGVAPCPGEAPFVGTTTRCLGIIGEAAVVGGDDHPRAGPVGRDPADGRPADARAPHVELQRLDEAAVEHFQRAGSLVPDPDLVVDVRREERRAGAGDRYLAVRALSAPDEYPRGPHTGTTLDGQRAGSIFSNMDMVIGSGGSQGRSRAGHCHGSVPVRA